MMISSLSSSWLFLAFLALKSVYGVPLQRRTVVHDRRDFAPQGYTHHGPASDDEMLHMRISLAMRDSLGLEVALYRASNPKSSSYGQWLSYEEVQFYSTPSQSSIDAVQAWLQSHGIDAETTTLSGDSLKFKIPISTAKQMLSADYSVYTQTASGKKSVRTLEYSLPEDLQLHIVAIHPTTSFYRPSPAARALTLPGHTAERSDLSFSNGTLERRGNDNASKGEHAFMSKRKDPKEGKKKKPKDKKKDGALSHQPSTAASRDCKVNITPECLQKLYGLPSARLAKSKSSIAVAGFGAENANKADLGTFLKLWRPDLPATTTFAIDLIDQEPGVTPGNGDEAASRDFMLLNLDIQYTVGLVNGLPSTFIGVGQEYNDDEYEGFLDLVNHLLKQPTPPTVVTSSFGFDREDALTKPRTVQLCNAWKTLTARGVSIVWATGDGGVAGSPENDHDCVGKPFVPTFPTCPFVTLVGATSDIPEKGAEQSAGGFSNIFERPPWQDQAVEGYLKKIGPTLYKGLYNPKGRAYPDVSTSSRKVCMVHEGKPLCVRGTSASAPIFASVIALLNHELMASGKRPMGFLNPWIYSHPHAFHDIKSGNNPGCGTPGFHALEGWDPVTGVGSPNYPEMKEALGLH